MVVFWILFLAFVSLLLTLDLGVFHKKDHEIGIGEALRWTMLWIGCALLFGAVVYVLYEKALVTGPEGPISGFEALGEYLAGYIIEKSLSLDNIFVMSAIFTYFQIPRIYQHRVLFWGILGAIVLRGAFIIAGAALVQRFSWVTPLFGILLLYSAFKMLFLEKDEENDLGKNRIVIAAQKIFPVTTRFHGHSFIVKIENKSYFTPLFLSLLVIETSDILFATDSIPAIFGITQNPFIAFTSNIMAILGLRSLYFALAAMLGKFSKLKQAIVFILVFVAIKMLLTELYKIPIGISLGVIVIALAIGILASRTGPSKQ